MTASRADADVRDDVPATVTYREIHEILATFARSEWSGMQLEVRGIRVSVGRHGQPDPAPTAAPSLAAREPPATASTAPATAPPATENTPTVDSPAPAPNPAPPQEQASGIDTTGLVAVPSPAVGAFWVAPGPGQSPFTEVGAHVERDAQVAIVEVMKLMNPVLAPVPGEIVAVCASNADLVEYEQVLFWIRPDD